MLDQDVHPTQSVSIPFLETDQMDFSICCVLIETPPPPPPLPTQAGSKHIYESPQRMSSCPPPTFLALSCPFSVAAVTKSAGIRPLSASFFSARYQSALYTPPSILKQKRLGTESQKELGPILQKLGTTNSLRLRLVLPL